MFFDPMYFLFIAPGLALSLWASFRVKSAFNKYSKVRSARGLTGAEAAQEMLDPMLAVGTSVERTQSGA